MAMAMLWWDKSWINSEIFSQFVEEKCKWRCLLLQVTLASKGDSTEDIPPPTPTKSGKAEKASSQQESNFDLRSHPNGEQQDLPAQPKASVRVRAPPGGQSSGFW